MAMERNASVRGRIKPTALNTAVAVELVGMHKWYGDLHVLRDINLKVSKGERIVSCAPSGSREWTMRRGINGREERRRGRVMVDGVAPTRDVKNVAAVRRGVGMGFPRFALCPPVRVRETVTLAPIWG